MTEIIKTKTHFIVFERQTVNDLMGTSAAASSPWLHGIKRGKHRGRVCWSVPKQQVLDRMDALLAQWDSLTERCGTMRRLIEEAK